MSKRQYGMLVVVALAAGLIGGIGASWVLTRRPAFVQPAPQPAKVIQAEKVEIVDKDRKVRAVLGIADDGEPTLALGDKGGQLRAALGVFHGEPSLGLWDKDGKTRARLTLFNGGPSLYLSDEKEKIRVVLGHTELDLITGSTEKRAVSSLVLFDKNGKVIWQAP